MKFIFQAQILLMLSNCSGALPLDGDEPETRSLILSGKIGDLEADVNLYYNDSIYTGVLDYSEDKYSDVEVTGFVHNDKLILNEFSRDDQLVGVFVGKFDRASYNGQWIDQNDNKYVPFKFDLRNFNDTPQVAKKDEVDLGARKMLETHFKPYKFKNDSIAMAKLNDKTYKVTYEQRIDYVEHGKSSTIIIFGVHESGEEFSSEAYGAHANSGTVAAAKYTKINGNYELDIFTPDCGCGYADWGEITVPKLEKYGDYHFLVSDYGTMHQGIVETALFICNTYDFGPAISFSTGTYSSGSGSEDFDDEYGYGTHHRFVVKNGKLLLILDTTLFKESTSGRSRNRVDTTLIYTYNERLHQFEE